jgi:hypothetical protein
MGIVPVVRVMEAKPTIEMLDALYWEYSQKVDRAVEGFVIALNDRNILKYVRMKNGNITPHKA